MSRPLSHRHALRAALAVTGRARAVLHTSLACALVTSTISCSQSNDTRPDDPPREQAAGQVDDMPAPVVNDETAASERPDCVDAEGRTSVQCCVDNRLDAEGCEICAERFPDPNKLSCLSCGTFDDQSPMCCTEVTALMEELGMSTEGDPLGCAPWGPPAPPVYRGLVPLRDVRPCPTHFRRERNTDATA